MDIKIYFFLFLIYSMIGWGMEVILGIIQNKKFVNRGFMIGPYCPIYGCGGELITIFLQKYINDPLVLFCVAIIICGLLEYFTSYIMEKVFKARWWDYSKSKFNINGRVCLETIIPFGLLGCFIMYVSNPFFIKILQKVDDKLLQILFIILLISFLVDFFVSFFVISRLRKTVKQVNKENVYDNTEEITRKVKEILAGKTLLDRRLINAFPKISIEKVKQKIKETTEQVKENVNKVKEETTEKIKEIEVKVKESTAKAKIEAAEFIKDGASKIKENTIRVKEETADKLRESASKVKESAKNVTDKLKKKDK